MTNDTHGATAAPNGFDLSYDDVPFPALCHEATHPGRLAAIAALLGMDPAPPRRCRVLELGCAEGTNLVAMALGLPDSTFVGIDLSARQIEAARDLAVGLGVRNVTFHAMDVMDLTPELGEFDYVVAPGLYSWVPPAVQDRVLTVCRRNLARAGVAYVSYNTFPGWHLIGMVGGMMRYRTRHIVEPGERARAARALIVRLNAITPATDRSGAAEFLDEFLRTRVGRLARYEPWEDAALLHDELSAVNHPVYVHEFVDHARRHGLRYLEDAAFPQTMAGAVSAAALAQLHDLADDRIEYEQYLDFLIHRTFRRTLLCHEDVDVQRTPQADAVRTLYVAARGPLVRDAADGGVRAVDGATWRTDDPVTIATLEHLGEGSPRAVHFPTLLVEACRRAGGGGPDDATAERLAVDLLGAAGTSDHLVELLAHDPVLTPLPSARPLASPLVRRQAQRSPYVSNLRHEQIELDDVAHALVAQLDGEHTRDDLVGELMARVDGGQLTRPTARGGSPDEVEELLTEEVDRALQRLGRAAVLLA